MNSRGSSDSSSPSKSKIKISIKSKKATSPAKLDLEDTKDFIDDDSEESQMFKELFSQNQARHRD